MGGQRGRLPRGRLRDKPCCLDRVLVGVWVAAVATRMQAAAKQIRGLDEGGYTVWKHDAIVDLEGLGFKHMWAPGAHACMCVCARARVCVCS